MKIIVIIFFYVFFCPRLYAQNAPLPIPVNQINNQAKRLIGEFAYYLPKIAMIKDKQAKEDGINDLKSLFESTAKVEVANARTKKESNYPIEAYLRDIVANYTRRFQLVIMKISINYIDTKNLQPILGNNGEIIKYKGTYQFVQGFCAKKEQPVDPETFKGLDPNNYDYCDSTVKSGEFFLEKNYHTLSGNTWTIRLGNITVLHYYDLKNNDN